MNGLDWTGHWVVVRDTVVAEFSDVPDLAEFTRLMLRLVLAALLGALLGIEREHKGKAAGIRTHMLVAMGAALFVLVPAQAGILPADMSRVIQGITAGIGFLCAGAIVKRSSEERVEGLTTAAGIWMTAAIGLAAGMGREATAVLSTLLALLVLGVVPLLVERGGDVSAASAASAAPATHPPSGMPGTPDAGKATAPAAAQAMAEPPTPHTTPRPWPGQRRARGHRRTAG